MRKWHRVLPALLVVAVLGGLVWLLFRSREPEPLYQGKPLTYWLQGFSRYPPPKKGEVRPTDSEAQAAIEHLGTNAIPTLLRRLSTPDQPLKERFFALMQRQHFIHINHTSPVVLLSEASRGFHVLGAGAAPVVPQLMKIYERHPNALSQQIVAATLGQIGPSARAAVPLLVRATTNEDAYVRNNAVYALGQIGGEPALVVPALTQCLEDPFDNTRANAADALATFGTNALPAVPALLKLLVKEETNAAAHPKATVGPGTFTGARFNTVWGIHPPMGKSPGSAAFGSGTTDVISPVTAALKAIDPEAAAKARLQ